jgi:anti-sigma regulatory factor (Ser/Thr protein kinase)
MPQVAGMKAAARYFTAGAGTQVGGDWYDAVLGPDGRLLLIIGDVAGRGIVAASAMGQLRSAARAYALDGHVPGALLERLNAFQIGLRNRGMTTITVVSVDPDTGDARYAKAGHPPPLLVHADGKAEWLDKAGGPPLGAVDGARYAEGMVRLDPGAVLLLYTDGLIEVRGESLDQGFERLKTAAIAAHAPDDIDRLCDIVLEQTLLNPAVDDDVTLLALGAAGERHRPVHEAFPHRRNEGGRLLARGRWPHEVTHAARVELPADQLAGSVARRAVDEALSDVSTPAELADLRIIVAEVVNNAIVHGEHSPSDGHVVMHVAAAPDAVRVEITNPGRSFDAGTPSATDEPGGFGLLIVDKLSTRWGVDDGDDTCVWFEIERP